MNVSAKVIEQPITVAYPFIPSEVYHTNNGSAYLTHAGVALLSMPNVSIAPMADFLTGFDEALDFTDYLHDLMPLQPGEELCKTAGQLCYLSLGPKRTMNTQARKYLHNIKESGHGSVLEHANYSFLFYGIDRSVTHEIVRHRAGMAYSQVSQRYVGGPTLRFVERPEWHADPILHKMFERRIDMASLDYANLTQCLLDAQQDGSEALSGDRDTGFGLGQGVRHARLPCFRRVRRL